jgi:NAD(P)H-dependent flavin oxidoreductase YrpB (nitropropane dioxygenase family)
LAVWPQFVLIAAIGTVLPSLLQSNAAEDIFKAAAAAGEAEFFPLWSGQSVGLIDDLPGAADIVRTMVQEAEAALARIDRSQVRRAI